MSIMKWFNIKRWLHLESDLEPKGSNPMSSYSVDAQLEFMGNRLINTEQAISNMSSKLSSNTQYLDAQMQKLLEVEKQMEGEIEAIHSALHYRYSEIQGLEERFDEDLKSRKGSASNDLGILVDQHQRLRILEINLDNDALDLEKAEYKNKERHEHCVQRMNGLAGKQDQIIDCIQGDRKVITELQEKVDKMDKLINKVARDINKGEKAKAEKDVVVLKKADKVQDKKLSKLEKKEPKAKKKVKK